MKKFEFLSSNLDLTQLSVVTIPFECTLYSVSTPNEPKENTLLFITNMNEETYKKLCHIKNSIIILNHSDSKYCIKDNYIIYSTRPRKTYAEILIQILNKSQLKLNVDLIYKNGYYLHTDTIIGENCIIEPFVYVDKNVKIGNNCHIKTGSKIRKNVVIGNNCIIKENSVIGSDGFGVESDEDGVTYKIPHLGGVIIGDNVEIGAVSVIAQGTINPTRIHDYVKIDDHVFIAHNVQIGKGSILTANSEISGSAVLGERVWIAPNVCIRDGLTIGDDVIVGMGSVVLKNISCNKVIYGNPAREKRENI